MDRPVAQIFLQVVLLGLVAGCADMDHVSMKQAMHSPFGTGAPFSLGTTKAEVEEDWGPPASIVRQGVDEVGNVKEEWIYTGMLPGLPLDQEYLSRTKHLYFVGNHLVRWRTEPLPGTTSSRKDGRAD